ncbi:hypothetical protein GGI26_000068 [Coemansia sp. RSA 1358]|nr:hypothetical protein GGI26_000068 [Coemansia sp. RSA 1358]
MVMASTGVSNPLLVRRLVREHGEDDAVELLVRWMTEDPDNPNHWWDAAGPAGYAGPPAAHAHSAPIDRADDAPAEDACGPAEDGRSDGEAAVPKKQPQHTKHKGAARQKKAESKKRQKEMAKLKKRMAARAEAAAKPGAGASEPELLAEQIAHIYI